jgi:hypothetical protein
MHVLRIHFPFAIQAPSGETLPYIEVPIELGGSVSVPAVHLDFGPNCHLSDRQRDAIIDAAEGAAVTEFVRASLNAEAIVLDEPEPRHAAKKDAPRF